MSGNNDTVRSKTYVLDQDEFDDAESITQLVEALEATGIQNVLTSEDDPEADSQVNSCGGTIETNASRK